jgi:hypothetical protein
MTTTSLPKEEQVSPKRYGMESLIRKAGWEKENTFLVSPSDRKSIHRECFYKLG